MKIFVTLMLSLSAVVVNAATTSERLQDESDGQNWLSYGRTYSENHFSPLTQINDQNVADLGLTWWLDLPPVSGIFSAPLAVDGVIYFGVGYSVIRAVDAVTGELLWIHDTKAAQRAGQKLRGGWGIRGIAYWEGRILTGTHDGRLVALNAENGEELWSVQTVDADNSAFITGPPWVYNGKVTIGHGGADFGPLRGYVATYDIETGKELWRFYMVPGNPADGFENAAMEMAAKTWTGEWWKHGGGGTVWHAMAYDPKFNRLYLGGGNGAPVNQKIRSPEGGDNLFLASIVAVDADTGEYVWHYQVNPGETWDFNANMDIELADIEIAGKQRSVLLHAPKNGFFYVIDRDSGGLIAAEPFADRISWAEKIDLATGRPVEDPEARYPSGGALVAPGPIGAHSLAAMSYSPQTGYAYIPTLEITRVYADPAGDLSTWKAPGNMLNAQAIGMPTKKFDIPPTISHLVAFDVAKGEQAWAVETIGMFTGGTAATAGNLVFHGKSEGRLVAHAADTGAELWSFDTQTGIQSQPITFMVDGVQYVSVIAGFRGMGGSSGANPDWEYRLQPRRLLTFSLKADAALPPVAQRSTPFLVDASFEVDDTKAQQGRGITLARCGLCHGFFLNSGGAAPDLRKSTLALDLDALVSVIKEGALVANGMPQYQELTRTDIESIQHYIRQQANAAAEAAPAALVKQVGGV